jgi:ATP-binding cassette, subfamily B, bacterial PglK
MGTLRQARALLGHEHDRKWVLLVVLALIASAFEAAGALIVLALMTWITNQESGFSLPLLGDLRQFFSGVDSTTLMAGISVVVAAFFVARAVVLVSQSYLQSRTAENAAADLATRLVAGYLAMPYPFLLRRNSAELIRNTYDTAQQFAQEALLPAVRLVTQSLVALALVAVLLATSPWATLLAVAVLGPFTWLLLRLVHPRLKRLGVTSQAVSRQSLQTLDECLSGWRDIRILGRERFFVEQFGQERRHLARVRYFRSTLRAVPRIAVETVLVLFILGFLAVSVIVSGGALEALPVLALFGYVAVRLQPSLNEIMSALNSLKFVGPGIDLLYKDLVLVASTSPANSRRERLALQRELRFENVAVRYEGAHHDALTAVDLVVEAGEFIGIVGPTGGGKSTLVDVMLGLLTPTAGRVTVDGVDLRGNEAAWHASLGVVHQTLFLADTTIRRNVALGVPDDEIDDAAVAEAIRLAQLEQFVASLPDGLESVVGQRAVRLSGGQRQRLAIARALYRRPSVLVFDEGTSALDSVTERELLKALIPLRGQRTIVAVAHRLSTVAAADRVVLIDDGRLVDIAPFDELAERHSHLLVTTRSTPGPLNAVTAATPGRTRQPSQPD